MARKKDELIIEAEAAIVTDEVGDIAVAVMESTEPVPFTEHTDSIIGTDDVAVAGLAIMESTQVSDVVGVDPIDFTNDPLVATGLSIMNSHDLVPLTGDPLYRDPELHADLTDGELAELDAEHMRQIEALVSKTTGTLDFDKLFGKVEPELYAPVKPEAEPEPTTKVTNFGQLQFREVLENVLWDVRTMLINKNRKYGNSTLEPKRIFSKASPLEQIKVRIDDKLSRIANKQDDDDEDAEIDLLGYLVIHEIAKRIQRSKSQ